MRDPSAEAIHISDAESLVMEELWRRHPQSADEVIAALKKKQRWQEATVKTLLNRLLKKGAIRAERDGRRYLYTPVLVREAWVRGESESLLSRVFGGRVAPLVAHFSKSGKLSENDVAELRQLLQELDDEQR